MFKSEFEKDGIKASVISNKKVIDIEVSGIEVSNGVKHWKRIIPVFEANIKEEIVARFKEESKNISWVKSKHR